MYTLVDADTACYAAAAMAEHEGPGIARYNLDRFLDSLLRSLGTPEHEFWITGSNNFRHSVYPEYKANRIHTPRPQYLGVCREHIVAVHGAHISDGCEADDMLGVAQCSSEHETMISSIDKDLLMIPGWHHIPELTRKGKTLREAETKLVSPNEAIRWFYTQLITGDPTDNIKGVPGIGKVGAQRILENLSTELEMFQAVGDLYGNEEELLMNASCLWIWRKMNDSIGERFNELQTS